MDWKVKGIGGIRGSLIPLYINVLRGNPLRYVHNNRGCARPLYCSINCKKSNCYLHRENSLHYFGTSEDLAGMGYGEGRRDEKVRGGEEAGGRKEGSRDLREDRERWRLS